VKRWMTISAPGSACAGRCAFWPTGSASTTNRSRNWPAFLDELKTERAQAEVDRRRTLSAFADALSGDAFDTAKADEAGTLRTQSAERVRQAVVKALRQIHAVLNADQRLRLAYLIRTGALTV